MKGLFKTLTKNNILEIRFLRTIFLTSLALALILPLYVISVSYPSFTKIFFESTKDDAVRAARHLVSMYSMEKNELTYDFLDVHLSKDINMIKKDFGVTDFKVLSDTGQIIFSTHSEDIGRVNREAYFHEGVATGKTFAEIIEIYKETHESHELPTYVLETYVPIMSNDVCRGAFAFDYDITTRKRKLDKLLTRSVTLVFSIALGFFVLILITLFKENKTIAGRKQAEEALQTAYDQLEQRVQERTAELQGANEQLRREIAERKLAEEALRMSEEKHRSLVETMNDGLGVQDEHGLFTYVNERLCEMSGYSRDELIGRPPTDFLDEANRRTFADRMAKRKEGEQNPYEVAWIRKDGRKMFALVSPKVIFDADGNYKGSFGVITDITNRKLAEEALKSSEEQLRHMSSQLLTVLESERGRIARELHDGIGQTLSAIKFKIEDTARIMGQEKVKEAVESSELLVSMIQNAVEEVRRASMELRPSTLDDLGIIATIAWFSREFQNIYHGIRIDREIDLQECDVPESLKIVIFRVLQEALNNIAKHSGADHIRISLTQKDSTVGLAIEDNGSGFEVEEALAVESYKRGFGLDSMRERTDLSGGSFSIQSTPGKGTILRASWPVEI